MTRPDSPPFSNPELAEEGWDLNGPWRFDAPIWTRRQMRPLPTSHYSWRAEHTWNLTFLANAVERVVDTLMGDRETCLRQAAVDIAVRASGGDLWTWGRHPAGGALVELAAEVWATWLRNDELPTIFATCAAYGGWWDTCWIYVDEEGLARCFPALLEPAAGAGASPPEMSVPEFVKANLETADENIRARGKPVTTGARESELSAMWHAQNRPPRKIGTFHQAVIAATRRP